MYVHRRLQMDGVEQEACGLTVGSMLHLKVLGITFFKLFLIHKKKKKKNGHVHRKFCKNMY